MAYTRATIKINRKPHNIAFRDHRGDPALMSWWTSNDESHLVPLGSWVFYMTNLHFSSEDFDGVKFKKDLEEDLINYDGDCRYEFFFLPGATAEECAAHYQEELAARGTLWRQINKVRERQDGHGRYFDMFFTEIPEEEIGDPPGGQKLPGLVRLFNESDLLFMNYHCFFFLYDHAEVQMGGSDADTREIGIVRSEPVPLETIEGEVHKQELMKYPVHIKRLPARGAGRKGDLGSILYWINEQKNASWRLAGAIATDVAKTELGWSTWF